MRLTELELENWGPHDLLKIDLSGGLQIEGRNGTGKSSILEAVRFIFSESGRLYKSRIKHGSSFARVKLRFIKDKDTCSIEKKLYPKKSSTANMWVNRYPVADNSKSVHARLKEILPEDVIDKLVYVPQGSLTEQINRLRMKGGRQELDRMFGIDRLEKVYGGINEELKVKQAQHDMLLGQTARYPEKAEEVYEKNLKDVEEAKKGIAKKLEDNRRKQKITDSKIAQLVKKIEGLQALSRQREDTSRKLNETRIKNAKLTEEVSALRNSLLLLDEKKEKLYRLIKETSLLQRYAAIHEALASLMDSEKKLENLSGLEAKLRAFEEDQKALNKKYGLEIECEANKTRTMKLGGELSSTKKRALELGRQLRDLSSLDGKPKCPRCGQKLTRQHISGERKLLEEELKKLERQQKNLSSELAAEEKKAIALNKELEAFRRMEFENAQRKKELDAGFREKENLSKDAKEKRKTLEEQGYKGEPIDVVESRLKELGRMEGETRVLKEDLAKKSSSEKKLKELEALAADSKKKEIGLAEELKGLAMEDGLLEDLQKRKDGFKEQKTPESLEAERLDQELKECEARKKETLSLMNELRTLKERISGSERETALMKDARDIFHTDKGLVKYLREKYIRQLSMLLTRNFARINQNPSYLGVSFNKDYELDVKTAAGSFSLDQLSGGEKVQLAIAFRIALLELLSPMRLLMLDEPFGSLDRDHRDVLGEALNKMAGEGQLIIVTHIPVDSLQLPQLDLGGY